MLVVHPLLPRQATRHYADRPHAYLARRNPGPDSRTIPRNATVIAPMSVDEVTKLCDACGVAYAPISKPEDPLHDSHLLHADGMLDVGRTARPVLVPALPLKFDGKRLGITRSLAAVGEHSREIAASLDYGVDEVARLLRADILVAPGEAVSP